MLIALPCALTEDHTRVAYKPWFNLCPLTLRCPHSFATLSQEVTTDCAASHFLFTIPAAATPSFRSPMVSLRWVLRFELLVGPSLDQHRSSDGRGGSGGGARSTQLQQLVWPLPLVVLPPAAVQV